MKKLNDIDKEKIARVTKRYTLLGAAQVSAVSASLFTWVGARCLSAHEYFLKKSNLED